MSGLSKTHNKHTLSARGTLIVLSFFCLSSGRRDEFKKKLSMDNCCLYYLEYIFSERPMEWHLVSAVNVEHPLEAVVIIVELRRFFVFSLISS